MDKRSTGPPRLGHSFFLYCRNICEDIGHADGRVHDLKLKSTGLLVYCDHRIQAITVSFKDGFPLHSIGGVLTETREALDDEQVHVSLNGAMILHLTADNDDEGDCDFEDMPEDPSTSSIAMFWVLSPVLVRLVVLHIVYNDLDIVQLQSKAGVNF